MALWGRFRTARAQRAHNVNYYGVFSHFLTSALLLGRTGHIHTMLPKWSTATVIFYTQPAYLGLNSMSERAPPIELIGMASVKWVTRYGK